MPPGSKKMRDFTQLEVWNKARQLRSEVYKLTRALPREEAFVLAAQMRRAAISVTANLAEGYERFSCQENVQFCRHGRGSAYELRDHFTTVLDNGYASRDRFLQLNAMALDVIRLLNGNIRSTKKLKPEGVQSKDV